MRMRLMVASLALVTLTTVAGIAKTRSDRLLIQGERVLAKLKLVDGSGSGLDADLLQGRSAAGFAAVDHTHPELGALDQRQKALESRTPCVRVVGDVLIFDGCI